MSNGTTASDLTGDGMKENECRFQVRHIRWWQLPKPLYDKRGDVWVRVGWVWNQKAFMVNNVNEGWIAFVDQQKPENLEFCPFCNINKITRRLPHELGLPEEALEGEVPLPKKRASCPTNPNTTASSPLVE